MSRKYKILCSIAGLMILVSIACMVFMDSVRDQPNPVGILLLVVGIVFWMFILARGFGMHDGEDEGGSGNGDDGGGRDSGCAVDTGSKTEAPPSDIHSPPPPESPPPPM
jgi:hypothetical protein